MNTSSSDFGLVVNVLKIHSVQLEFAQIAMSGLLRLPAIDFSVVWSDHRFMASAVVGAASSETGTDCIRLIALKYSSVIKFKVSVCVCVCDSLRPQCWSDGT